MPNRAAQLQRIAEQVRSCTLCRLHQGRTNAVPGDGPLNAELMFVGEAPGREEDRQGRPFVGRAGQYLSELLAMAGFRREQVFITNVVKCRPPENREPRPDEVASCHDYLRGQIEMIRPRLIVLLGTVAVRALTGKSTVSSLRGQVLQKSFGRVTATYHPASALYNPGMRRLLEEDFRRLPSLLRPPSDSAAQRLEEF